MLYEYKAHLSAQQDQEKKNTRFPFKNEEPQREIGFEEETDQRQEKIGYLTPFQVLPFEF